MDEKEIKYYKKKIKSLGNWYQPIKFSDDLVTPSEYSFNSTIYGMKKWNYIIRRNLPKNLKGKKILELGCSSGLYSVLCAKEGAKVTAIELDKRSFEQAKLTVEIFSKIDGVDYSKRIKLLNKNFMKIEWEKIDIVIAFNVLYWVARPYYKHFVKEMEKYRDDDVIKLLEKVKKYAKSVVIQGDENKFSQRKKAGASTAMTNAKTSVRLLKELQFKNINIDKPINIAGFVRAVWNLLIIRRRWMSEVDLKKPWRYSRPIITAEAPKN